MTLPSKDQVAKIAAGLTKAQEETLTRLAEKYAWADRRSVKALEARGLALTKQVHGFSDLTVDWFSVPTPLGSAIAKHLQDNGA